MAFQAEETHAGTDVKPFHKQYRLFHATFAQFCYTGAQVAIAGAFINYVTETRVTSAGTTSSADAARFLAGAQGTFTVGRFAGSFIMKFVKPRYVFLVFMRCVSHPSLCSSPLSNPIHFTLTSLPHISPRYAPLANHHVEIVCA
jgi:fucose permease